MEIKTDEKNSQQKLNNIFQYYVLRNYISGELYINIQSKC